MNSGRRSTRRSPTGALRAILLLGFGAGVGLSTALALATAEHRLGADTGAELRILPAEGEALIWRFDEGGTYVVREARGRVPEGWLCGARRIVGPSGRGGALWFDGRDDFVLLPVASALSPRDGLTLALWVWLDRRPEIPWRNDFRFVLAKPSLRAYSLVLEQDGTLQGSVYVGGRRQGVRTHSPLPLRTWVHVAFLYDGRTGRGQIYLNGRLEAEEVRTPGSLEVNDDPLVLGSALLHRVGDPGAGIRSFPGGIDELRIYPRALDPDEIARLATLPSSAARRRGGDDAPPPPARLVVQAVQDGEPVVARVVVWPVTAPPACPEVAYTDGSLTPPPPPGLLPAGTSASPMAYAGRADGDRGTAELFLEPGRARIAVDLGGGITGEVWEREIALEPARTYRLSVEPPRTYNPRLRRYFGADLHLHSRASGDAVTPLARLISAQQAADLDLVVLSDHNTAVGHLPFAEIAARRGIPYLLSEEITTASWGHFNPFPLRPGEAIPVSAGKRPRDYFQEARSRGAVLIQVNHPLWGGGQGYLHLRDDPAFDGNFQLVEVLNGFLGKRVGETDRRAVEAVFALWSQGRRVVATAGSDDHNADKLVSQVGTPRTYVALELEEGEPLTAERWLDALAQGQAFVTTGPLVYLEVVRAVADRPEAGPGRRLRLDAAEELRFRIALESVQELRSLSLWYNGRVLRTYPLQGRTAQLTWVGRARPGWYAVTVEAEGGGFALTNPVWVESRPPVAPGQGQGQGVPPGP